jgi:phosphatidylglycerol lysyltransferase
MLEQEILRYGYALLFVGGLVEADAFLITAAFLAHRHYLDIRIVIPVSIAATVIANQFWFRLGRSRGRAFFERRAATDPRFARMQGWLTRQGAVMILSSRFLWGLRSAIPAAYGAVGSNPWLFTRLDGLGAVVWGLVVGLAAYVFGGALGIILRNIRQYELVIAAAMAVGLAAVIIWRSRDRTVLIGLARRHVEAGGDTLVALLTLAQSAGRLMLVHPHGRLAALAVLLGSLNIVTAVVGTRLLHMQALSDALPFELRRGSRVLMLLAGMALVYIGRGLARRKRIAWTLSFGLVVSSIFLNLGHNGAVIRAAFSAVIAVELWRQRNRFHARSDPLRLRFALASAPVLALALTVFGAVGLREFGHLRLGLIDEVRITWQLAWFQEVPELQALAHSAPFVWSLRLLHMLSAAFVLVAALAPVAWRRESAEVDERVHDLAWASGVDSMSYFAKQPDKKHVLEGDHAFLGYRVKGRIAIVAGDPVGSETAIMALVHRFVELCRRNDWVPVFYETSQRYLAIYRQHGLRWFKIGEEAVLPLETWSLEGGKVAKVRQFINKVRREAPDLQVSEYRREVPDPEIDDQLEEISDEWLSAKKGREMGFNLGIFSVEELNGKRTIIAQHESGVVDAFVTWLPYRGGRAVVLDAMRRRERAQAGVMDLLIAHSALIFKKEGLEAASLAVAPLANADEDAALSHYDRGVKLLFDHFSTIYGYQSLFQYKKKFNPQWDGRYLVFPRPDQLARIAYALVAIHYSGE